MGKTEAKTDLWVYDLLKEAGVLLDPQGSSIKEIDDALKTASKKGTGNVGRPEFIGVVKDFVLIIEDKSDISKHERLNNEGGISTDSKDIIEYAVNGALFYARHIIKNTNYEKVIAFGVSGDAKRHKITPLYVEDTEPYTRLEDVESFISFNESNIDEYYKRSILHEDTSEKDLKTILKDAADLHEYLRIYGSLGTREKPIVVSGILLALDEIDKGNFEIKLLTGDKERTDGQKILAAIISKLLRDSVRPEKKKDKILAQFNIFKTSEILNTRNNSLNKTPLRYFAEFLYEHIYKTIKQTSTSEDYLGRFYSEFMSYGGGDGQELGIILTPKHITDLFCDLAQLKKDDVVLDPCCGTAGFLVAAMHHMLKLADDETEKRHIRQQQLHGIEIEDYMFTIAVTNMILRGDGKSNIESADFLSFTPGELQRKGATIGMINPPYSLAKKKKNSALYEICFIEHMLDSLAPYARAIAIIPQSSVTGKTKEEQAVKENILKHHTLEGVITLNTDTFYGVGVNPCIAVFTAHVPHPKNKECKFIDFKEDGYKIAPHIGLIETESAKDKKQHLLDVWFDRIEAPTKFCVKSTIEATDEWLHAFYYFNDKIPTEADFDKTIADYLTFEFSMIAQGRGYLFEKDEHNGIKDRHKEYVKNNIKELQKRIAENIDWKEFFIKDIVLLKNDRQLQVPTGSNVSKGHLKKGTIPRITVTSHNNGIDDFYETSNLTREYKNFISISFLGDAFYHPYKATTDMKVHTFQLANKQLTRYTGFFIITMLKNNTKNSSYGYQLSSTDLPLKKVLLPVTSTGDPDYKYMEDYMRYLEQKKILQYLDYINRTSLD